MLIFTTPYEFYCRFEELYNKRIQQNLRKKALADEQVCFFLIA